MLCLCKNFNFFIKFKSDHKTETFEPKVKINAKRVSPRRIFLIPKVSLQRIVARWIEKRLKRALLQKYRRKNCRTFGTTVNRTDLERGRLVQPTQLGVVIDGPDATTSWRAHRCREIPAIIIATTVVHIRIPAGSWVVAMATRTCLAAQLLYPYYYTE